MVHLTGIYDMKAEKIEEVLELAQHYCIINNNEQQLPLNVLRGKMVGLLFFEPSTRTKASFYRAAKNLGADVIDLQAGASSVAKGESVLDTAVNLRAMGLNALVVRHTSAGIPDFLAHNIDIPVINAGDGAHEHPTQALLDLLTIKQEFGRFAGLNVLIMGDILHSRVARSNIFAMSRLGINVSLAGPATLVPQALSSLGVNIVCDVDDALAAADIVYMLRIQKERQRGGLLPSLSEYAALFGVNERRLPLLQKHAIIMHPGPVNLGIELTASACFSSHSRITTQVNNGVAVRMAVLHLLLSK